MLCEKQHSVGGRKYRSQKREME